MKVLITGAAGFIGSHLAESIKKKGHDVYGVDNFSDYYDIRLKRKTELDLAKLDIPIKNIDLASSSELSLLLTSFDYIFHLAAQPGISAHIPFKKYVKNNILATENLMQFALKNKKLRFFANISTSSVYGLNATKSELAIPQPVSHYGVTKLAAEQLTLSYVRTGEINGCSLRLYSVYGPRERPDKLYSKLIRAGLKNKEFTLYKGSENHLRSYTYIDDIVQGIIAVIGKEEICNGEVINLGNETQYTTKFGIKCVESLLNTKVRIKVLPSRVGDQLSTKAHVDKAKKILNYDPNTKLESGLQKQIEWIKQETGY